LEERVYRQILDVIDDGVYLVDRERRITFWNEGAARITGFTAEEVQGHSCSEGILRHVSEQGKQLCLLGCPLAAVMRDGAPRQASVYLHHKEGHRVPVVVHGDAILDAAGAIVGSVEIFRARAASRYTGNDARERADDVHLDPITTLATRRYGERSLEHALAALGSPDTTLGVLFLDIDKFKHANDTHGHAVGDRALRMVGRTIAHGLRGSDVPVRWGGDEFVVLLPGIDPEGLAGMAERLRMLVEHSWFDLDGVQVRVTVSVGATMARAGEDADSVVDRADRLMYASKSAGRNVVTDDRSEHLRILEHPGSWETMGR
jgi:diguanylate cyclase (GGDEF)-like protein/PAS domain S-box-containing protein